MIGNWDCETCAAVVGEFDDCFWSLSDAYIYRECVDLSGGGGDSLIGPSSGSSMGIVFPEGESHALADCVSDAISASGGGVACCVGWPSMQSTSGISGESRLCSLAGV